MSCPDTCDCTIHCQFCNCIDHEAGICGCEFTETSGSHPNCGKPTCENSRWCEIHYEYMENPDYYGYNDETIDNSSTE